MDDRLRKMKRIQDVQARLHQVAEQNLIRLQREQRELKQAQVDIVDAMAGRLNRLAVESEKVTRAEIAQERRVREEALRLKRAERMSGRLDLVARRNLEKLGFRDLLEGIGHDKDASLP